MHPYSSKAKEHQEHSGGHNGLGDIITTNEETKQTYLNREII
jgi:hypothetical protein